MGKIAYLFDDYLKDLASASIDLVDAGGSCVDSNYPITNLQDEQVALQTRTDAKVAVKLQFDLGSTKQLQAFFIGNHNFTSGTFDINSSATGAWAGEEVLIETKTVRTLDVYHYESSAPVARQYWEFDFTNTVTTDPDNVFKIGRAMVYDGSNPVQITDIEDYIRSRGYGYKNLINRTLFEIRWVHKLMKKRERFLVHWGERENITLATELRTLYESVYGDAHPFVFIPDIAGTPCYYGYLEDAELLWNEIMGIASTSHTGGVNLRFIEAVRSKA